MLILLTQAPDPPPADTAPVGLSPTAALITGIALIVGVLITTGVQMHIARQTRIEQAKQAKEDRDDQRQRDAEQRTDQRERDAEQREDQRQRDKEAWEREDRHRFVAEKRTVYGEVLSTLADFRVTLNDCSWDVFFDGQELDRDKVLVARKRFQDSQGLITLLAPDPIRKSCDIAYSLLVSTFYTMAIRPGTDSAAAQSKYNVHIEEYYKACRNLAVSMRDDLAIPNLHGAHVPDRL